MHPLTCTSADHDRSLPEGIDPQDIADDGLLACNDCHEPTYYCVNDDQFHHVNPHARCFLIQRP